MSIQCYKFSNLDQEMAWIAENIQKKINQENINPEEIAVISRKHSSLQALIPYLDFYKIPIWYELGQDVLQKPHIVQITTILKFVYSLFQQNIQAADELLPEILSYPFWQLDSKDIWQISVQAFDQKKLWLDVMLESENERISEIGLFLLEIAKTARAGETAEKILDVILGVEMKKDQETGKIPILNWDLNSSGFHSPYKNYYFDDKMQSLSCEGEYLSLLSHLRTLIAAVRDFKKTETILLKDIIEFLDLHEQNKLKLIDNSYFNTSQQGVNLLTAHKAKGLEFTTVFVINCDNSEWFGKNKGNKLSLPINLPFLPDSDNQDDKLRLFYVALTRSKDELILTTHLQDHKGKSTELIVCLDESNFVLKEVQISIPQAEEVVLPKSKYRCKKDSLLLSLVENYQLSVTHLHNFLDVTRGGPQHFLQTNLLRFPQSKTKHSSYGTCMHAAISEYYHNWQRNSQKPDLEFLLLAYLKYLKNQRLSNTVYAELEEKGKNNLTIYWQNQSESFSKNSILEKNFKQAQVVIGKAHLSGQIDKLDLDKTRKTALVTDFKTGTSLASWKGKTDQEKIKLWKFEDQLVFYKILLENSIYYPDFVVNEARIEFLDAKDLDSPPVVLTKFIFEEEVKKLANLIQVVYEKIITLEFLEIDIEKYPKNMQGIEEFIHDLQK